MNPEKSIAVIGIGCLYPDAANYKQLWENVLSRRRAFRKIPEERLNANYFHPDHQDAVYMNQAAVLRDFRFDREAFKISGSTFRTADIAHWIALQVATDALQDCGNTIEELPKEQTGVFVGNTLTGEFTRSNLMRLRWPYVAQSLVLELRELGWAQGEIDAFLSSYEQRYKAPFPAMEEDSLAGGLSNTIAGRICNYFDFKGGGYTVDGACSSSLLAVTDACRSIRSGELVAALAGGVDISLDPFELVGFSRAGALAKKEMLVFDRNSNGFWPGEGCGFVLLMDYQEAVNRQLPIHGLIRGWGISSDGQGGLTRPVAEGQQLALERAYRLAGFPMGSIGYLECHGTGTHVGDQAELTAIKAQRGESEMPLSLGSIKANIGHTKAAAGIAGFIKTLLVLKNQVIPPFTGNRQPHDLLDGELELPTTPSLWPKDRPLRAAVSAMGFGGINTHITLENPTEVRKTDFNEVEQEMQRAFQDEEIFLFAETDRQKLKLRLKQFADRIPALSLAELTDVSCTLLEELSNGEAKAAIVASNPEELQRALQPLIEALDQGIAEDYWSGRNAVFGDALSNPRIGLLFPGQGNPMRLQGGWQSSRFPFLKEAWDSIEGFMRAKDPTTEQMQPLVASMSVAGLSLLEQFGVEADLAVGHSFGEIPALHWAGACDRSTLLQLAEARGRCIHRYGRRGGAMLAVVASGDALNPFLKEVDVVDVAAVNAAHHTVLSGPRTALEKLQIDLKTQSIASVFLNTDQAFHSEFMSPVIGLYAEQLQAFSFAPCRKRVVSTVTGQAISAGTDLHKVLIDQLSMPVRFQEACRLSANDVDLWIEVGSTRVLSDWAQDASDKPAFSIGLYQRSLYSLLTLIGNLFVRGAELDLNPLLDRFYRRIDLEQRPEFLVNPCERNAAEVSIALSVEKETVLSATPIEPAGDESVFLHLLAQKLELPATSITESSRMLDDLHLNSITVGELISKAAKQMGVQLRSPPTEFANASVAEICQVLESGQQTQVPAPADSVDGIEAWVRPFKRVWVEENAPVAVVLPPSPAQARDWLCIGSPRAQHWSRTADLSGRGLLLDLTGDSDGQIIDALLQARTTAMDGGISRLVVLQTQGSCSDGFIKSWYLEDRTMDVLIVECSALPEPFRVRAELESLQGFRVIRLDAGKRWVPRYSLHEPTSAPASINDQDVFLVTGGGKGITAECALELGRQTGAKLVLVGRSQPHTDEELADNLRRFEQAGVHFLYRNCDVTDPESVAQLIESIRDAIGAPTGLIHGAGNNQPKPLRELGAADIESTLKPKCTGLDSLLAALSDRPLRFLVTLGSIIAHSGMAGNADYALANARMAARLRDYAELNSSSRCINLAWSVWSGTGMGERLGVLETLLRQGVQPISIDRGVELFMQAIHTCDGAPSDLIFTSRFDALPTMLPLETPYALSRFLENVRVLYPRLECISDCRLSAQSDPYLLDHCIDGELIFPTVMGMEAMAQVIHAMDPELALLGTWDSVELLRPIAIPPDETLHIRIIANRRSDGAVACAIRTELSDYQEDHFRAVFRSGALDVPLKMDVPTCTSDLDPQIDLYGNLLFHQGRFQRIRSYAYAEPYACAAALNDGAQGWFGSFQPKTLRLGDPGARDALLHCVQVCVPHKILLPASVERIVTYQPIQGRCCVFAEERSHQEESYVYDLAITDDQGRCLERWQGVEFRRMQGKRKQEYHPDLVRNIWRRLLDDLGEKVDLQIVLDEEAQDILHRADGKPWSPDVCVSRSHNQGWRFEVKGSSALSCDMETVVKRTEGLWMTMLGEPGFQLAMRVVTDKGLDLNTACTAVWAARESLRKAGLSMRSPLIYRQEAGDWLHLQAEGHPIYVCALQMRGAVEPLVMALLLKAAKAEPVATPVPA